MVLEESPPPRSGAAYLADLSPDAGARGSSLPTEGRIATPKEASDEVNDLLAELAAESAVARSWQQEAEVFLEERDTARAELQNALAKRPSAEEQREMSSELLGWQADYAELPVLRAQLQTTELEECAASERSAQVETWLQRAATEAREALAIARQMATAEATCLAEISEADAERDEAQYEMQRLEMRLLNVESENGVFAMKAEEMELARQEAEVAVMLRRRVEDVEATSEARIEDLESQLRSFESRHALVESRQAKARALYQASQAKAAYDAESMQARAASQEEINVPFVQTV
jgi:hypothetical protein